MLIAGDRRGASPVVQLFFGDKIALASMRARVTEPHEAPELHAMIERLCQLADLPKPKVAVAETELPNAFAAGRSRKSATVCVTTGLMQRLEPQELEGVIAHELSHIANRDVVVMTVAGFLATVAGLLVRFGIYSGMGGGRGRDNGGARLLPRRRGVGGRLRACRSCSCGPSRATASSRPTAGRRS